MSLGNVFHLVGCAISREQADISLKYLDWKKDYDVISCIFFPGCVLESIPDFIPIFDISLGREQPDSVGQIEKNITFVL